MKYIYEYEVLFSYSYLGFAGYVRNISKIEKIKVENEIAIVRSEIPLKTISDFAGMIRDRGPISIQKKDDLKIEGVRLSRTINFEELQI